MISRKGNEILCGLLAMNVINKLLPHVTVDLTSKIFWNMERLLNEQQGWEAHKPTHAQ